MPAKRIPQLDTLTGATSATDDRRRGQRALRPEPGPTASAPGTPGTTARNRSTFLMSMDESVPFPM